MEDLANAAAPGAHIILYGVLDSNPTPFPLFPALAKQLTFSGYTLFGITQSAEKREEAKAFLLDLFNRGALLPILDKTFAFEDIQNAHRYMESNQQKGKIIVKV